MEVVFMATVPGPNPDKPLPRPGAPAEEPPHEPIEEPDHVGPDRADDPRWVPQPYDPERERDERGVTIGLEGAALWRDLLSTILYRRHHISDCSSRSARHPEVQGQSSTL